MRVSRGGFKSQCMMSLAFRGAGMGKSGPGRWEPSVFTCCEAELSMQSSGGSKKQLGPFDRYAARPLPHLQTPKLRNQSDRHQVCS